MTRTRAGIAAGIVIVAAILVVWLLVGGNPGGEGSATPSPSLPASPDGSAAPPDETPAASPTAEPSPPAVAWALNELPGGPARGAARIGDRWVALDDLHAWTSADGASWEQATVDETPQEADGRMFLGRVGRIGATWYSVGMWIGVGDTIHPVVWSSQDGTSWNQVPAVNNGLYYANDVASDGSQLAVAAANYDPGDGGVWTSADGATWTEHQSDGGPATVNAIHGDADGFVAVGFRMGAQGTSLPVIWYSADGASWTDAAVPTTDSLTLLDVARLTNGRYVALGIAGTEVDAGRFVAWYADDPSSWTDGGAITGGTVPGLLAATDAGLVAVIGAVAGPTVWTTTDGQAWSQDTAFPLPDTVTRASAAASDGDSVLILGGTDEGEQHFAWLSP